MPSVYFPVLENNKPGVRQTSLPFFDYGFFNPLLDTNNKLSLKVLKLPYLLAGLVLSNENLIQKDPLGLSLIARVVGVLNKAVNQPYLDEVIDYTNLSEASFTLLTSEQYVERLIAKPDEVENFNGLLRFAVKKTQNFQVFGKYYGEGKTIYPVLARILTPPLKPGNNLTALWAARNSHK